MDTAYRVSPLRRGDPERLGEYWLTGRLGSGGMGVVYLATDRDDNFVAIKLVHATLVNDPEFRGRFRSEVERARQVPSFCTAEVLDADLDHNPPYLVVEYVDGPSLGEVVEERGPLREAALHSLAVGVATALTGIHGAGVIHRDLKPDNVLLAPGSPKVIDFGIARAFEATSQHTRTDQMVGTVAYMAPERFSSEPGTPLTAAADVFAWGCVVAYAGTGQTPFHGDSPPATAARILTQPPHLNGLPESLREIVALSLSKDPEERPTARELLDMLLGDRPGPRLAARQRATVTGAAPVPVSPAAGGYFESADEPYDSYTSAAPQEVDRSYGPSYASGSFSTDHEVGRPRGHRMLAVLAILLVVAGVATVALVLNAQGRAGNPLTTGSQRGGGAAAGAEQSPEQGGGAPLQNSAPPTTPADYASDDELPGADATRSPVEPGRGELIIEDELTQPGQWLDSEIREQNANCFTRGVMRVARVDAGTYQCVGPDESIVDDFGVEVSTVLQSAGSCAAIWFHWDPKRGGQVLRVCQEEMSVVADTPNDREVYGRIPLDERIELRQATRIHLVVRDGQAQVFRDGDFAGAVRLPKGGPDKGQVLLGMSVGAVDADPPYVVTFSNVKIRSF
ncbi:serine/threonine protein kinase [Actinoplanes sp. NPDC049599]|uniref:serine/threonine protein kinase n=1 Tax=Actinoplanes sp. NPDC049599 TaxID=3363903 RepID=UPI0037BDEE13